MRLESKNERIDFLKRIEIFQDLEGDTISLIANNLIEVKLEDGKMLFEKGEKGDSIYIVWEGELEARDGEFVIRLFKQGFVLGEFALLANEHRSASVYAKTSGPLVAGVIGERKFAYDVWGDSVNTASRMESSGTPGKINVSGTTYELTKDFFEFEYRGRINAKNKGEVDMYYVNGIRPDLCNENLVSNDKFWELYNRL